MKRFFAIYLFIMMFSLCKVHALENSDYTWRNNTYDINSGSQIGNTYYSWDNRNQSYTGYTRQGNQIYGSDGSSYTQLGNTIQNNNTGRTYQINNNLVEPLY